MAWRIQGRLAGVEPFVKAVRALPKKVAKKILRKAVTKGSQPIYKAARQTAPTDSKLLKKSLLYKVWISRKTDKVLSFIGPRLGFKKQVNGRNRDPRYYAHILEGGRKAVVVDKAKFLSNRVTVFGKSVKAVAPTRFMSRAFKASKGSAETAMIEVIKTGIQEEMAKAMAGKTT